jgi:TonB family protein
MIPQINGAMVTVSGSPILSTVARVTIVMALAFIGTRLARRSRAAVRHVLLTVAFGALLVLPAASVIVPAVRIAVPIVAQARTGSPSSARGIDAIPFAGMNVTPATSHSLSPSPASLWLMGWIVGAALFLLPMILGLRQVRLLRRTGSPWPHGQSVVEGLALDAGVRRRVEVLLHEAVPGPMTCGVVHPAVVLPVDAQKWDAEDLNRAIVHELEHVRRGDWIGHCLARAVCAAYWFHPLVWIAWRRLALEAERSCDDAVLGISEAIAYADQLVAVAQGLSLAAKTATVKSPLLAMASHADLATRVGAVLDSRQRRGRVGVIPVALACAAAAVIVLTLSPIRMVAAPQSPGVATRAMAHFLANEMLVIVDVTVSDRNGRNIEGLRAGDFAVTEDDVEQTIRIFEFQNLDARPPATPDPVSSYYILGYYTTNSRANGTFRRIRVTGKADTIAKLDYRSGYYARSSGDANPGGTGHGDIDNKIGVDATPPVVLYRKDPEYSEEARKAKYSGTVVLSVEVDASGRVADTKVIRSLGLGLDEKAMEAVRQWRFRPGMKDGMPVTVVSEVEVNFRLL